MPTKVQSDRKNWPEWRLALWASLAALLIAPAVAMRFTVEVAWTGSDFLVAAALLLTLGAGIEVAARKITRLPMRLGAMVGVVMIVGLVWAEGAVGLF